jgi:RNA polymerase sigma-70 factor (ECF subfamily)
MPPRDDEESVSAESNDPFQESVSAESNDPFLELYDRALPEVYGYLLHRCGNVALAEDLTSEVFLAAARSERNGSAELALPWLIAVARNKLVDYWRRREREERGLSMLAAAPAERTVVADGTEEHALEALDRLPAQYRAALTLRYVDGLSVPEVASQLDKSVHAAESLLARARNAFRALYLESRDD